ncbi:MAG: tetratricopeptide repeat protein [FCB group bacterium]|nr:tetratricopeptide repeat protein [FCB group bacterium]
MKRILPLLILAVFLGCAVQYELIEEEYVDEGPQWTEAQVDSIIRYNRMFFFDYYSQMSRKNEFGAEGCDRALSYFWQYIEFDTARKYNDYPQAARCYIEWAKEDELKADSARIIYEMGSERYPDSDYLHNALGIIYKNKGDLERAEMHFTAASEIDPAKADYIIPLTEIYQENLEWVKAKDACEKVLAIDPANSTIRDRMETILRDHFTPEEYIKALLSKIELEPENIDIRIKLAKQYFDQGKDQEAKTTVEAALLIDANNVEALELLGVIFENLQEYSSAIEAYKRILNHSPGRVDIILDVASNYKNLKKYTSARTYVLKALEVSPGNGAAYLKFGEIYEAAADQCSRNKQASYSDKLVFAIAFGLFDKSANSDDYDARSNASRKMKYLENNQILPQKSDWFMHQNDKLPTTDCYNWIKPGWSEVKYIESYLKRFSG